MSKFDKDPEGFWNRVIFWLFFMFVFLLFALVIQSCTKKHTYIITTSTSIDTVIKFNKLGDSDWIWFHNEDGTQTWIYNAKIDTIN